MIHRWCRRGVGALLVLVVVASLTASRSLEAFAQPTEPDPLLEQQWHLKARTDRPGAANVRAAWTFTQGAGIVIGIVDDGLQHTHPDLEPNYLPGPSWDFNGNDPDPSPTIANSCFIADCHGTAVTGIAAARGDNGIGVSGAAPLASLAGLRLVAAPVSDAQEAAALAHEQGAIHISSNSWGPSDDGQTLAGPGPLAEAAMATAIAQGRAGKGRVFVWAAGNGALSSDNCNFDGYANHRFVIAVGAVTDGGQRALYSESCSALFVTAPSNGGAEGITTTDLVGSQGYSLTNYYANFGGTSAAAPLVSGVVALMLAEKPSLTWRDVQHILVRSSYKINPTDPSWSGGVFPHSEKFGFGLVDAEAAVRLAGTWTAVLPESAVPSVEHAPAIPIPDNDATGVEDTIEVGTDYAGFLVEHIEVEFTATHPHRGDLEISLTSPAGVVSLLATRRPNDAGQNFWAWRFRSVRHWGESAAGRWTLRVADRDGNHPTGTWDRWTLRIFGTSGGPFVPPPVIDAFAPVGGARDSVVTIAGRGFSGATAVLFNAVAGSFAVASDTEISATVPPGATTGRLVVIAPGGTATSATDFVVLNPLVSLVANRGSFATGDRLVASVRVENPGFAPKVDFYFGAILPDGDTVVFFEDFGFSMGVGSLSNPRTLRPIAAAIDLSLAFLFDDPAFFTYVWQGGEPPGPYQLFLAVALPGAFADNSVDAGDLVGLAVVPLVFTP